jgi:hypothetical protein
VTAGGKRAGQVSEIPTTLVVRIALELITIEKTPRLSDVVPRNVFNRKASTLMLCGFVAHHVTPERLRYLSRCHVEIAQRHGNRTLGGTEFETRAAGASDVHETQLVVSIVVAPCVDAVAHTLTLHPDLIAATSKMLQRESIVVGSLGREFEDHSP